MHEAPHESNLCWKTFPFSPRSGGMEVPLSRELLAQILALPQVQAEPTIYGVDNGAENWGGVLVLLNSPLCGDARRGW